MTATENVVPAIYRSHDEGDGFWSFGGLFTFKLTKAQTDGAIGLIEVALGAGTGPPRHIHPNEDEIYLILEGEVTFSLGDEKLNAGPGAVVYIPRGLPHDFRVDSDTARFYLIFTPAGFEEFFWRCGAKSQGQALPSQPTEQIIEAAKEHNPPPPTPEQFIPIATMLGLKIVAGVLQVGKEG